MSTDELKVDQFDKLWDYGNPEETAKKFREFRPRVEAHGDLDLLLQLDTQIARTYGLRGKYDESHKILDTVEAQLTPEHRIAVVRYLLERGRSFNSAGDKKKARALFLDAFTKGKQIGTDLAPAESLTIDAAHMLGIAEESAKALEWNQKAIALAEKAKDPRARGWLGSLLNNTGWTYHDQGDFAKALELFTKCLAFNEEQKRTPQVRIAKWTIGRTYRSMKRYDEAIAIHKALLEEYEKAGEREAGFCPEEIGECLWALDRKEQARPYLAAAYEKLAEIHWIEDERIESLHTRAGLPREEDL